MLGTSGCLSNATDNGASSRKLRFLTLHVHVSMESLARRLPGMPKRRRPDDMAGRVSPSGSTASLRKKREALKRLHSSATPSEAHITVASELPSYDVSTIDFAVTPTTKASTTSTSSTPTTSTDSPKLNRREQMRHRLNRMLSMTGIKASRIASMQSIRSSSSIGLGLNASTAAGTNTSDDDDNTSASGDYTPPRRMMRSSIVPNLTITPTSDGSGSNTAGDASPAASVRTVYRVNPATGRPAAQQAYNPSFLSPARAKTRARTTTSPRFVSRRSSASPSPSPRGGVGFPRRTSSLRHSNEFPFNPSAAGTFDDDSDLYASNPSSPVTDESSRLLPAAAASSPALVAGGSSADDSSPPPQFNKPLPTLPREEQPPISVTPFADDDVFFDAKSPAAAAPSWPLPADRQSVYGGGDADPKTTTLLNPPPPLPPMSAARAVAVSSKRSAPVPVHDLPTATSTATSPKAEVKKTASSDNNIDNDEYSIEHSPTTLPFTPSSSSAATATAAASSSNNNTPSTDATIRAVTTAATRDRAASGSSELSMYGFHYYNALDDRVMAVRRARIEAEIRRRNIFGDGDGDGDSNDQQEGGDSSRSVANDTEGNDAGAAANDDGNSSSSSSSSSSAASSAVIGDGFLPLDGDEDHVAPLLPPPDRRRRFTSHSQGGSGSGGGGRLFAGGSSSNRDSVVSVMTDATAMSFVTAAEGVLSDEDEDDDQWESTEEDDGVDVDVDARVDAEEGGAESSGHRLLLLSSPPRAEHVLHRDDVGDHAEKSLRVVGKQEEPSMDVAEDEAEVEPDTFQLVSKDGTNSSVMANLDAVEEASSGESGPRSGSSSGHSESSSIDDSVDISARGTEPLCVSPAGPPELSSDLAKGKMTWEYDPFSAGYNPKWAVDPDVEAIKQIARSHYALAGLPNDNVTVEFLAEGAFNKVYTVSSTDSTTGNLYECVFRCCIPNGPWYKLQSEVATMELVRRTTKIPVPKVFAFDSSMENPLGLEWMLMEKINGRSYDEVEDDIPFDAKVKLYRQAAEWIDELSRLKFDSIGALYHDWSRSLAEKSSYKVGPLCTSDFSSDLRLDYAVNRGPFTSFEQYYQAHISFTHYEAIDPRHKERVEAWNKQEEMEEAGEEIEDEVPETHYTLDALARIPKLCLALQSVLPTALDGKQLKPGSTALHHFDISKRNILVDGAGAALTLIDWETSWVTFANGIPRYPPLVREQDVPEPPPWDDDDEEKGEERLEDEKAWEDVLLRREFDRRLEELGSPHLQAGFGGDSELSELNRIVGALDSWTDWSFIERMREKMRKVF